MIAFVEHTQKEFGYKDEDRMLKTFLDDYKLSIDSTCRSLKTQLSELTNSFKQKQEKRLNEYILELNKDNNETISILIGNLESAKVGAKERKKIRKTQDNQNQERIKKATHLSNDLSKDSIEGMDEIVKLTTERFDQSLEQLSYELKLKLDEAKNSFNHNLRVCRSANRLDLENGINLDKSISDEVRDTLKKKHHFQQVKAEKSLEFLTNKNKTLNEAQLILQKNIKRMEDKTKTQKIKLQEKEGMWQVSEMERKQHIETISELRKALTTYKEKVINRNRINKELQQELTNSQNKVLKLESYQKEDKGIISTLQVELHKNTKHIEDLEYKVYHLYNPRAENKCQATQTNHLLLKQIDENIKKSQSYEKMKEPSIIQETQHQKESLLKSTENCSFFHMSPRYEVLKPNERIQFLEKELKRALESIKHQEKQESLSKNEILEKDKIIKDNMQKLTSSIKQNAAYETLLSSKIIGKVLAADSRDQKRQCLSSFERSGISPMPLREYYKSENNLQTSLEQNIPKTVWSSTKNEYVDFTTNQLRFQQTNLQIRRKAKGVHVNNNQSIESILRKREKP